jgi:hypothetical protein
MMTGRLKIVFVGLNEGACCVVTTATSPYFPGGAGDPSAAQVRGPLASKVTVECSGIAECSGVTASCATTRWSSIISARTVAWLVTVSAEDTRILASTRIPRPMCMEVFTESPGTAGLLASGIGATVAQLDPTNRPIGAGPGGLTRACSALLADSYCPPGTQIGLKTEWSPER